MGRTAAQRADRACLSRAWLSVDSVAGLTGLTSFTASRVMLPLVLMMLALGFVGGYQMGQTRGR